MDQGGTSERGAERALSGPRDAFLYLLNFVALYLSAVGALMLAWALIDAAIPDPLRRPEASSGTRTGISMVVVSFPLLLYVSRTLRRNLASGEMPKDSLLRRILTYLSLFVIAITSVVDLILVIYAFLGGDLTGRFALRGLSVLLVVGLVFWFYLLDIRDQRFLEPESQPLAEKT